MRDDPVPLNRKGIMLAKGTYEKEYIESCRAKVGDQLELWNSVKKSGGADADALEPLFMMDLVLVMDSFFAHRTRGVEGKDGNPVNEVTMIRDSLHEHGGVFTANKTIKYKPEKSVLGLEYGQEISLTAEDLGKLAPAYFNEMIARFT